ncbi:hypothetical protein DNFV4_01628 [Nitrospira tepida]|uniref:ABC-type transport system, permease component n=1 Tax=Nitrospira tepida TaxID=2973512 RepID=A0AA86TB52_9BACT|nr:ABC transporter permease subunit [Nitrospira tepida]CAI4031200.1 hypothetical protein DNFV4_01628 [Nitrospira tepida]
MTPIKAIIAKELRSAFVSPIIYVVAAVFLLIFGVLAQIAVVSAGNQAIRMMQMQGGMAQVNLNDLVFRPIFGTTSTILLLILPLLTMRLFAEERKLRTFEFLMTAPISVNDMVLGKFLSAFLIFLGMLGLTGLVPLVLSLFSSFDWYPVLTGYLGLVLLGGFLLATGLFASTLTENQIIAAFLSFGLSVLIWFLYAVGSLLGDNPLGQAISYLSVIEHFDRLVRGLVSTKDLVYFVSGIALMLFLAHRVVESQRWK